MIKLNKPKLTPFICPVILLIIWEIVGQLRLHIAPFLTSLGYSPLGIPDFSFLLPISIIFPKFFKLLISGIILPYLWDTTWRSLIGFVLASLVGVTVGIPLGLSKRAEELFLPTVDAVRTIPPVALLPLIILFFGIDHSMKVAFIFVGSIWPVLVNTAQSVKSVDPMYIKVAFNSGHSNRSTLFRVIIPSSLPGIFAGLRISLSISVILSIVSEMMAGNTGLGFFLNYSKRNFDYDDMFSAIIVIAILGWLLNMAIHRIDRHVLSWYYHSRDNQLEYSQF